MEPLARLFARNAHRWAGVAQACWINPGSVEALAAAGAGGPAWTLVCDDVATWRGLQEAGHAAVHAPFPDARNAPQDTVLLTLPREKPRLRMLAHCAASLLRPGGQLWLAGEKRAGIGSAARHLEGLFEGIEKADTAGHGALLGARRGARGPALQFDPETYRADWTLATPAGPLSICSWPGVFAHGSLDEGTAFLLENLPGTLPGGRVLDLACGAGVIGAWLARCHPVRELCLSDASASACLAARATLSANALSGRVLASDGLAAWDGAFDLIISNPPFHRGHRQDTELGRRLVIEAGNFLTTGGQLLVVVNRHLPYRRWLEEGFGRQAVVAETPRYQLLQAWRPLSKVAQSSSRSKA